MKQLPAPIRTQLRSRGMVRTDQAIPKIGAPTDIRAWAAWNIVRMALFFAALAPASLLGQITVSSTGDGGAGSLRQAILDVPAGGTIDFSPGLAGQTIPIASELVISKNLTIDAASLTGGVVISANGSSRVIRVAAGRSVVLRKLTFSNGNGQGASDNGFGGGLFNEGTTTVERCTFTGNTVLNYGGAIYNALNADLTVTGTTFTANSAGLYGAAISNSSVLLLNGSTFDGNHAGFEGGGIYSDFSSTLTVNNSTFTANTADFFGGAIFNGSPRFIINSSTLVANTAVRIGGGIYNDFFGTPSSQVSNTIVALNTAPEGADIFGPRDESFNFTGGDPKLSPLGFYGGPTKTMPPLPDSPVIDAGGTTTLSTDQRGQPRLLVGGLDIGAYEVPYSNYNPTGVTIHARVPSASPGGVFEISTDPDFLPVVSTYAGTGAAGFADATRLSAQLGYPSGVARDSQGSVFFADTGNHRIRMITSDGQVSTIAGTGVYGMSNGSGATAQFAFPSAIAVGADDQVYVSDTYNHRVCKLSRPSVPGGSWAVTTLAGTGLSGYVNGTGSVARFSFPYGLTLDGDGNVYVADSNNHRIRRITPGGSVSNYAGSGASGAANSASSTIATFNSPKGIALLSGSLYVADTGNHLIRRIVMAADASSRTVSTFAGSTSGFADGAGAAARFHTPSGITTNGAGVLYIADEQNHRIRQITATADVSTVAGTGTAGLVNGRTDVARFQAPTGVTVGIDGNLIVADSENHALRGIAIQPLSVPSELMAGTTNADGVQVRSVLDVNALGLAPGITYYFRWKSSTTGNTQLLGQSFFLYDFPSVETRPATNVSPASAQLNANVDPKNGRTVVTLEYSTDPALRNPYQVSTPAGSGTAGYADGTGTAARFSNPTGVVANAAGDVFVADRLNHRIRRITAAGVVSTFAGSGDPGFTNGTGTAARFEKPAGLAIDAAQNLYVADEQNHQIRKITPAGVVSVFAGSGIAGFVEGAAATARFLYPTGVAVDADGNVYVADSGNHRIRRIAAADGTVTTYAGTGVAGTADGAVADAQFSTPKALALGAGSSILVADTGNHTIRVIDAGNVTTLAGDGTEGFANGLGTSARFSSPTGVCRDTDGSVFVSDSGNHRIRRISPDGVVDTLAGSGIAGHVDSPTAALYPATATRFHTPAGITVDSAGRIHVTQEGLVRKIARSATLPFVTVAPDATGSGARDLSAIVNQPLLYGSTYYFRARGTSYRDSITGAILSFVTPQAMLEVFAGADTAASRIDDQQTSAVDFGDTPNGQPVPRAFTVFNPGTWPLTIGSVNLPAGFQLSGSFGVIPPGQSATANIVLSATVAGHFSGSVWITSDAPEQASFTFPVAGVVIDPPDVTTLDATDVAGGEATFHATVNPKDSPTTVWFEWSQDSDFDGVSVAPLAGSSAGFADGSAENAMFDQPQGLATDADGNTYVADTGNHRIRKVAPDGTTTTMAGSGVAGYADGTGSAALFDRPTGIVRTSSGLLFVTDSGNHRIRAITPAGVVSTFAGLGTPGFTDGIPTAARFNHPTGLAIDANGQLYVADTGNHRIRKVAVDGSVSTLAGDGTAASVDGVAGVSRLNAPFRLIRDSAGYVYVTESNGHAVRRVSSDGSTITFAGSVTVSGDANGMGTAARFNQPSGLAVGVNGLIYVADTGNHRIRSITPAGEVKSVAGTGVAGVLDGLGDQAKFSSPSALAAFADGSLAVGENGSSRLRAIDSLQVLLEAVTGLIGTTSLPVSLDATGVPAADSFYFRAIATNGGGTTVGNVIMGNGVSPITGFAAWQASQFGTNAGNASIAGPGVSPSGDGVSNLLKYAFGLDPFTSSAGSMPAATLNGGSLSITYNQVLSATDITYTVQWSTDMVTWSQAGVTEQIIGSNATTRQVRASVPTAPDAAKFLRIQVSQQ